MNLIQLLVNSIILLTIDMIWLNVISNSYQSAIQSIQNQSPAIIRPFYAIPVYIALAYLLTRATNKSQAFLIGLCTYAVYDFTMLTLFNKYPVHIALLDTLWGGILLLSAYIMSGLILKGSRFS